jgi:hypothetical protein
MEQGEAIRSETLHARANTTDRGIIYVEPQLDKIVTIKIGARAKFASYTHGLKWKLLI